MSVQRFDIVGMAEWRRTVADLLLPLDIRTEEPEFRARIDAVRVRDIRLFTMEAPPHRYERTTRLAGRSPDPFYAISYQLSGRSRVAQHGHVAELEVGDFAVYDTTVPYSREFPDGCSSLVVMFPQQLIDLPPIALSHLAGRRIDGSSGMGAVVSAFLGGVARNLDAFDGRLGLGLAGTLVDLVTSGFAAQLEAPAVAHPYARLERLMAVREWIMDRLGDPDLTPARVAAGNYLSTRGLHELFREQGTTVGAWIRQRRLEMARRDLADPLNEDAVALIAERWGFRNPTHFARAFREAYGASPREYRRAASASE